MPGQKTGASFTFLWTTNFQHSVYGQHFGSGTGLFRTQLTPLHQHNGGFRLLGKTAKHTLL